MKPITRMCRLGLLTACAAMAMAGLSGAQAAQLELQLHPLTGLDTTLELPVGADVLAVVADSVVSVLVMIDPEALDTAPRRFRAVQADTPFNPATGPYVYIGSVLWRKPGGGRGWWHVAEDQSP